MTDPGTTRPDESILAPDPASAGARTQPGPNCDARRSWVPIRSLAPRHRARIAAHLCALDANDRHLRFGYPANDTQISRYVDMLDFEHDEVFGVFNRRLDLIALAHLAHPTIAPADEPAGTSEFGVSVLPRARGRGFGHRLFEHAMLHARNRGVARLLVHALSENTAMLRIAKAAGATIEREGAESEAMISLPPGSIASHLGEMVEQRAAEVDFQLKRSARQVAGVLDALSEVKSQISKAANIAEE